MFSSTLCGLQYSLYSMTTNMERHKITYKTKDGTIKEQRFDEFNEFADAIEDAAMDYFSAADAGPEIDISSALGHTA